MPAVSAVQQPSVGAWLGGPDWLLSGAPGDLSLSLAARPIPARLVQQIQAGRFVEMRDLLWDNVAIKHRIEDLQGSLRGQLLPVSPQPRVREVTTLPSWVCCFLTYLAAGTLDPVTRDKITYAMLVVREAMKHGGRGWLDYDRLFRQQAALNPNLPWNVIHPELQATTILGQRPAGSGTFCALCQECDHVATQCALAQLQQPGVRATSIPPGATFHNGGKICYSWNKGACIYPGACNFRHVCSIYHQASHPARDCRFSPRLRPGVGPARPAALGPQSSSK